MYLPDRDKGSYTLPRPKDRIALLVVPLAFLASFIPLQLVLAKNPLVKKGSVASSKNAEPSQVKLATRRAAIADSRHDQRRKNSTR